MSPPTLPPIDSTRSATRCANSLSPLTLVRKLTRLRGRSEAHGGKILDPPSEYAYWPGYYSVFFTDPDGIKLEVVMNPQHRL